MDTDGIIIIKGGVIRGTDFNDRVYIAVLLYLAIRIGGIAHQGGPAELEIAKIIAVIDDLAAVRIGIQDPALDAVLDLPTDPVPDEFRVAVEYFRHERLRPHVTPP